MPWTWVRPLDASLLEGRPLLDLGTGDGQTISALTSGGVIVGLDSSELALRTAAGAVPHRVCGVADAIPFADRSFEVVVAGDLFHHLDEHGLLAVLAEARRVLRDGGRLVAWWYAETPRADPHGPRFPRTADEAIALVRGFSVVDPIELVNSLDLAPATAGLVAVR
jgi:SAM-dependent methyltransferase